MTKQTSNSLLLVGAIIGSLGFVAFAASMAAGNVAVSPVTFLVTVVAFVAGILLFPRFPRRGEGREGAKDAPVSAERDPVRRAVEPGSMDVVPGAAAGTAPAPERAAAPAGTEAEPGKEKPGTLLKDERDLATRKGSWKCEESAAAGATGPEAPDSAPVDISDGEPDAAGATIGVEPARLGEAREGGPDDLKRIKGVGPKLEEVLHRMGVFHYDQIASWNDKEVVWIDENLKDFRGRVSRDDWVDQARRLAAGGEAELPRQAGEGDRT